jgi:hypothetical protein
VSAPGLDEAVSSQPGDTLTQQFSVLVRSNQASLLGPEAMNDPAATPKALNLYDPETVTVVDAGNDTYHLVYDPTEIRGTADRNGNDRPDDTEQTRMESGDVFTVNFTFEGSSTEQGFAYFPATAEFTSTPDEERPVFYPLFDHRLAGETTVAPGSTVTVEFTSTGDRTFQDRHDDRRPPGGVRGDLQPLRGPTRGTGRGPRQTGRRDARCHGRRRPTAGCQTGRPDEERDQ